MSGWLKDELGGYHVVDGFADDGYFERLNRDDSSINILMGSRSFYEGWDSNRPNVITFINIGTGTDAKKFILQAVGRGVRVQPTPTQRRRLQSLYNAGEFDPARYRQIKDDVPPLETAFIFGTNRIALQTVIGQLHQASGSGGAPEHVLELPVNKNASDRLLLIPVYRQSNLPMVKKHSPKKFEVTAGELALLQGYVAHLDSNQTLLARHNATPRQIGLLHRTLSKPDTYFNTSTGRMYGSLEILLPRLFTYFDIIPQEFDRLKPLDGEINHFRHIKVQLADITELQAKIDKVAAYKDPATAKIALKEQFAAGEIDLDEYTAGIENAVKTTAVEQFHQAGSGNLEIRYIASHYYVPLILSDSEKIDYCIVR